VDSSGEFVNVMTHIVWSHEFMREDFRKALSASKYPGLPNIVINKRFKYGTSFREAYETIVKSEEWMHPDIKSFSKDGEFAMFLHEESRVSVEEYLSRGLLIDTVLVREMRTTVSLDKYDRKVRGSGCDNVLNVLAHPISRSSSVKATETFDSVRSVRCRSCFLETRNFFHTLPEYEIYLKLLNAMESNNFSYGLCGVVCRSCIEGANTIEAETCIVMCTRCNEEKSSFSTCFLRLVNNGDSTYGTGICTDCVGKKDFTTVHEFMREYPKRFRAGMCIKNFSRNFVAKRSLDQMRCEPDNLFDAEHGQMRKKILKIDDSMFGK